MQFPEKSIVLEKKSVQRHTPTQHVKSKRKVPLHRMQLDL